MLTNLKIENFKCFRQLEIKQLARVNLFVGLSNSGKTAVLEGVDLLPQKGGFHWSRFRDQSVKNNATEEFTRWMFCDLKDNLPLRITGQRATGPCIVEIAQQGASPLGLAVHIHNLPGNRRVMWHPSEQGWISKIATVSTEKTGAAALAKDYDRWTRIAENDDRFVEFLRTVDNRLKSGANCGADYQISG